MNKLIFIFLLLLGEVRGQLSLKIDSVFKANLSKMDTANANAFQELKSQKEFKCVFKRLDTTTFKYAIIEIETYNRLYNKHAIEVSYRNKEYYFHNKDSLPFLIYINKYVQEDIDSVTYNGLIKQLHQHQLVQPLRYSKFQKVSYGGCIRWSKNTIRNRVKMKLSSTFRIVFLINNGDGVIEIFYNIPVKHPYFFLRVNFHGGLFRY